LQSSCNARSWVQVPPPALVFSRIKIGSDFFGMKCGPIPFFNYAHSYNASAPIENGYKFMLLLHPFGNIRCFSFVKWMYLDIF
jgi:hypothetical protein